jgi:hypothetical protein
MVISGSAHVIDITGAQAFLTGGRSSEVEFYLSQKVIFELVHSSWGEKNRRVPRRDEHIARLTAVTLGLEEGKVFLA